MKLPVYCLTLLSMLFCGCDPFGGGRNTNYVDTYVPVYAAAGDQSANIAFINPIPTVSGGKIFVMGNKLFQVEEGVGIHIIDYADKQHPKKLSFLNIPGCKEVALQGANLYTNSYADMLVVDMAQYPNLAIRKRQPGVFPELSENYPPDRGYFVCPDPSKGRVVKWTVKKIKDPQCYH